jgi:hypothetical protein
LSEVGDVDVVACVVGAPTSSAFDGVPLVEIRNVMPATTNTKAMVLALTSTHREREGAAPVLAISISPHWLILVTTRTRS